MPTPTVNQFPTHSLVVYEIILTVKGDAPTIPLIQLLTDYFTRKQQLAQVAGKALIFQTNPTIHTSNCFDGYIKSGHAGVDGIIYDTYNNTEKKLSGQREIAAYPHYYYIKCKSDKKAIIVLHKISNSSIKVPLSEDMNDYIKSKHDDHSIKFSPLVNGNTAKEYFKNAKVEAIKWLSTITPSDDIDILNNQQDTSNYAVTMTIRNPKDWLVEAFTPQANRKNIKICGKTCEKISFECKLSDGRTKTFKVDNIADTGIDCVLSADCIDINTGLPIYIKIKDEAKSLADEF